MTPSTKSMDFLEWFLRYRRENKFNTAFEDGRSRLFSANIFTGSGGYGYETGRHSNTMDFDPQDEKRRRKFADSPSGIMCKLTIEKTMKECRDMEHLITCLQKATKDLDMDIGQAHRMVKMSIKMKNFQHDIDDNVPPKGADKETRQSTCGKIPTTMTMHEDNVCVQKAKDSMSSNPSEKSIYFEALDLSPKESNEKEFSQNLVRPKGAVRKTRQSTSGKTPTAGTLHKDHVRVDKPKDSMGSKPSEKSAHVEVVDLEDSDIESDASIISLNPKKSNENEFSKNLVGPKGTDKETRQSTSGQIPTPGAFYEDNVHVHKSKDSMGSKPSEKSVYFETSDLEDPVNKFDALMPSLNPKQCNEDEFSQNLGHLGGADKEVTQSTSGKMATTMTTFEDNARMIKAKGWMGSATHEKSVYFEEADLEDPGNEFDALMPSLNPKESKENKFSQNLVLPGGVGKEARQSTSRKIPTPLAMHEDNVHVNKVNDSITSDTPEKGVYFEEADLEDPVNEFDTLMLSLNTKESNEEKFSQSLGCAQQ